VSLEDLAEKRVVSSFGNTDLLIDHGEDPHSLSLQELQGGTVVDVLHRGSEEG
jgi:hypothetical protein